MPLAPTTTRRELTNAAAQLACPSAPPMTATPFLNRLLPRLARLARPPLATARPLFTPLVMPPLKRKVSSSTASEMSEAVAEVDASTSAGTKKARTKAAPKPKAPKKEKKVRSTAAAG